MTNSASGSASRAFILLGSNIDPDRCLPAAVEILAERTQLLAASTVWQTSAVGDPDQADFLNAAVLVETTASARELKLEILAGIEQELGRVRDPNNKNAPRTIDLDVGLFNDECLKIEHRDVPDPDILKRPFAATPLAELDPDYIHPVSGQSLREIADRLGIDTESMVPRPEIDLSRFVEQSRST